MIRAVCLRRLLARLALIIPAELLAALVAPCCIHGSHLTTAVLACQTLLVDTCDRFDNFDSQFCHGQECPPTYRHRDEISSRLTSEYISILGNARRHIVTRLKLRLDLVENLRGRLIALHNTMRILALESLAVCDPEHALQRAKLANATLQELAYLTSLLKSLDGKIDRMLSISIRAKAKRFAESTSTHNQGAIP